MLKEEEKRENKVEGRGEEREQGLRGEEREQG